MSVFKYNENDKLIVISRLPVQHKLNQKLCKLQQKYPDIIKQINSSSTNDFRIPEISYTIPVAVLFANVSQKRINKDYQVINNQVECLINQTNKFNAKRELKDNKKNLVDKINNLNNKLYLLNDLRKLEPAEYKKYRSINKSLQNKLKISSFYYSHLIDACDGKTRIVRLHNYWARNITLILILLAITSISLVSISMLMLPFIPLIASATAIGITITLTIKHFYLRKEKKKALNCENEMTENDCCNAEIGDFVNSEQNYSADTSSIVSNFSSYEMEQTITTPIQNSGNNSSNPVEKVNLFSFIPVDSNLTTREFIDKNITESIQRALSKPLITEKESVCGVPIATMNRCN